MLSTRSMVLSTSSSRCPFLEETGHMLFKLLCRAAMPSIAAVVFEACTSILWMSPSWLTFERYTEQLGAQEMQDKRVRRRTAVPHDLRFLSTANLCLFVLQMWILVNRRPVHRGSWARRPTWRGNATATLVSICKRRLQSAHSANVKSRPRRTEFQTRHLSSLRSRIVLYFRASADHNFALYRGCLSCDQPPTTVWENS